jgi:hypothetical protein
MQKTPFPGCWELMPTYQIQAAEFALKLGKHYHARAQRVGYDLNPIYVYSLPDCIAIIKYWQERHNWAQFKVLGYVGSLPVTRM